MGNEAAAKWRALILPRELACTGKIPLAHMAEKGRRCPMRGKILRDTARGQGLIVAGGQQHTFVLDGVWKSEVLPTAGMAVDVEINERGEVVAACNVSESQIAKEQTERAIAAAKEKGSALAAGALARFGWPALLAAGLLIIGWFFLSAISIQNPLFNLDFSFWQLLGLLNSNNPLETAMGTSRGAGAGFYGVLAVLSILGPFLCHFWKDRRASLAGLLPVLFMLLIGILVRNSIHSLSGAADGGMFQELAKEASDEMMKALRIGFGVYLSLAASLYFAVAAIRRFLLPAT
jgi:hypothetical protein